MKSHRIELDKEVWDLSDSRTFDRQSLDPLGPLLMKIRQQGPKSATLNSTSVAGKVDGCSPNEGGLWKHNGVAPAKTLSVADSTHSGIARIPVARINSFVHRKLSNSVAPPPLLLSFPACVDESEEKKSWIGLPFSVSTP